MLFFWPHLSTERVSVNCFLPKSEVKGPVARQAQGGDGPAWRGLAASAPAAGARIGAIPISHLESDNSSIFGAMRLNANIQRLTDSVCYDALMRVPITVLSAYFLWREVTALRAFLVSRVGAALDGALWAGIAAHVATSAFLLLLLCFFLTRLRPVKKSQGLLPRFAAVAVLTVGYLVLLLPRAAPDPWYQTLSAVIIGIGSFLCVAVVMQLGRSLSIMPEARRLVTTGYYRHIRHPLYLVEQIASFGIFLQFRSLEAAFVLLVNLAFQFWRMHEEEKVLVAAFPEYVGYRARTARLIPGIY